MTRPRPLARSLFHVGAGIVLLVFGAKALVAGAIDLARAVGITERVIGLTAVALGTSLPELASSLVAALKREGDIVLGNIVGSNIFNILCILGATAALRPVEIAVSPKIAVDLVVMFGLSVLIWPFLATGLRLTRWEGLVLLAIYVGYTGWLFV